MTEPMSPKRKGKRLLVAAVGVATASYVSVQGCAEQYETVTSGNLLPGPPQFEQQDAEPAITRDAAVTQDSSLPTSGNLLPPPPPDAMVSGNLVPPPPVDAAMDTSLPNSGNLLPPPPVDAAVDAGKPKDAQVKDALPPVGNLLPPPPPAAKE